MRCWNCDAQLRPGAQICPNCHADQNVAYGDWDQSLPIPVRRPDPRDARRRDPDERATRDRGRDRSDRGDRDEEYDRSARRSRDDYPPRERRGRDDYDDYTMRVQYDESDAYEQRPSRDARESRDDYDDRGSRSSRRDRSGRSNRDDRDDSAPYGAYEQSDEPDDRANRSERVERQGREDGGRRARSSGDEYDERGARSERGGGSGRDRNRTPKPPISSAADDSREEPAYTDDSLAAPAYQPSRSGDRDRRDSRDSRDPSGSRATPPARGRASSPENRHEGADAYSDYEQDQPARIAARESGRSGGSGRDSYQGSRGAPRDARDARDRGLPDPLDDPRAPRPLRTSTPLRDQRDPRSGRSSPGPSSMPGGMGASGNPGAGRSRSRADYEGYDPGAGRRDPRDPRDRSLPGPSRGGPSGGRMPSGQGYVSGGGSSGSPGGQGLPSRRSMQGMQEDDPWSTPGVVNPGMYGSGGQVGQRPGRPSQGEAPPAAKPNRTRMIAVILLVALVVLGIAGAGYHFAPYSIKAKIKHLLGSSSTVSTPTVPSFATYTPGPTPTVLPNDKLNTSQSLRYNMDYPTTWELSSLTNTTPSGQTDLLDVYTAPGSVARITIETGTVFANLTNAQAIQGEVTNAEQVGAQFTPISSATRTQQIGGQTWLRQEYSVTLTKTHTQLHMAILATNHLGREYVITLTGDASEFTQDDSATFEPMLTSFRFS